MSLTDEDVRILRAVRDGRMRVNEHGRYVIDGETRPDRKTREQLLRRNAILWPHYKTHLVRMQPEGERLLKEHEEEFAG